MTKFDTEQKALAKKLTTLQKKFVINLVSKSMSQREAYVKAGGTAKTESGQDTSASEIMSKPKVKAFYDSLMHSAASGAVLTKQRALEILTTSVEVTIADICDFISEEVGKDGKGNPIMKTSWVIKSLAGMPREIVACIKSITMTSTGPKVELYDSHGAIKQLADMIGWNVPRKTTISGPEDAPIEHKMTVTFIDAATKE